MSNGDDVLENWEEFDEADLHSALQNLKGLSLAQASTSKPTEQFISPALPNLSQSSYTSFDISASKSNPQQQQQLQQPMKLLQRSSLDSAVVLAARPSPTTNPNFVKSPLDDMAATFQPVMMVLHKPEDEYQSANYTQPIASQTVKILRRPTQSSEPRNNGMRPKQPIKTLKQREQEYAEARLRILGSAKNPEDDEQRAATAAAASAAGTATSANNATPSTPTSISTPTTAFPTILPTNVAVAPIAKINSPKTQQGGGGPNMYNNHYQYQQQQQQQQQQQLQLHHTQQQHQPPTAFQQQHFHPNYQQQQNFFYNQQQPQSPAYNNSTNNNRTFSSMPLLGHGPMGAIGQPAQYQQVPTPQSVTAQAALHQQMKIQQQQYIHNSSQQQHQKQQQQQQQQTWSPVVGGSVSSASLRQQQNESILRVPRGPDGTVGFQTRR